MSNLYEFNKINMAQIKPVDPIWFNQHCAKVAEEMWNTETTYWMLLCRERNDYTIFYLETSKEELSKALIETLNNRGNILDFTKQPDNNYEIWVRDIATNENFVYYLFNYSDAVIIV